MARCAARAAATIVSIPASFGAASASPERGDSAALTRAARLAPLSAYAKDALCAISGLPRCCAPCTLQHGGCAENLLFRLTTSRSRRSRSDAGQRRAPGWGLPLAYACMRNPAPGGGVSSIRAAPGWIFPCCCGRFRGTWRYAGPSPRSAARGKTSAGTRSLADAALLPGFCGQSHLANSFTLFTGVAPGRCRELFSANRPSRAGV